MYVYLLVEVGRDAMTASCMTISHASRTTPHAQLGVGEEPGTVPSFFEGFEKKLAQLILQNAQLCAASLTAWQPGPTRS